MMAGAVLFIFLCFFFAILDARERSEFCDDHEDDGSCVTPRRNASNLCTDYTDKLLTAPEKNYVVGMHNLLRENLTSGVYGKLPKAFYIKKVSWNEELAKIAQTWAQQCKAERDLHGHEKTENLGRNVAVREAKDSWKANVENLMKIWLDGLNHLTPEIIARYQAPKGNDYDFASITQMIWWNTTEVGCGRSTYNLDGCSNESRNCTRNKTMVELVCNYFPAGNRLGDPVYNEIVNTLLCHYEKKAICRALNSTGLANDLPNSIKEKPHDYRVRNRMIELWPAASNASHFILIHHIHNIFLIFFMTVSYFYFTD